MPWPPAAFSRGMSVRTVFSSTMVFTATQSGSDSDEMVGRCSAGSWARIYWHTGESYSYDIKQSLALHGPM